MKIGPRVDAPNTSEIESEVHSANAGHSAGQSASTESSRAQTLAGLGDEYSELGASSHEQVSDSSINSRLETSERGTKSAAYAGKGAKLGGSRASDRGNGKPQTLGRGNGAGSSQQAKVDFPHNGKHQPPSSFPNKKPIKYTEDPTQDSNTIAPLTGGKGSPALYHTPDAAKVRQYEDDARQNGLQLYNLNPNAHEDSKDVVHLFNHPIGADGGETTHAMRLDGDHGHPIREDGIKTSFKGYMQTSVENANRDINALKTSESNLANIQEKYANKDPNKLKPREQREIQQAEAKVAEAKPKAENAEKWKSSAAEYLTSHGEIPKSYKL